MPDIATNRKARRDFQISDTHEAGIELKGTEVKAIRLGLVNLNDAFARIDGGQVQLHQCDIQPYDKAGIENHEPRRPRRLLLHKREIARLAAATQQQGQTLVALRMYWKNRRVKVEVGLGKGKAKADQREDMKRRTVEREAQRAVAGFNRRR